MTTATFEPDNNDYNREGEDDFLATEGGAFNEDLDTDLANDALYVDSDSEEADFDEVGEHSPGVYGADDPDSSAYTLDPDQDVTGADDSFGSDAGSFADGSDFAEENAGTSFDATPGEYKEDVDLDTSDDAGLEWANRDDAAYREATEAETTVVTDDYDGDPLTVEDTPSTYEAEDDLLVDRREAEDDRGIIEKVGDKINEWMDGDNRDHR